MTGYTRRARNERTLKRATVHWRYILINGVEPSEHALTTTKRYVDTGTSFLIAGWNRLVNVWLKPRTPISLLVQMRQSQAKLYEFTWSTQFDKTPELTS